MTCTAPRDVEALQAVLEAAPRYAHAGVAWVGLLVLDEAHQGRGQGGGLGRRGSAAVRLAVVRLNEAVLPFWRRCGFTETGETHPYRHGPVASESVVLRKSLRG